MTLQSPVKVSLEVGGVADVRKAFRTVLDAAERAEKAATEKTSAAAKDRVRMAKSEAAQRAKQTEELYKKFQKAEEELAKTGKKSSISWLRGWTTSMDEVQKKATKAADAVRKSFEELGSRQTMAGLRAGIRDVEREMAGLQKHTSALRTLKLGGGGGGFGSAAGSVARRGAGAAMQVGGMALALGGGFTIADAVQRGLSSETAAVALANSMYNPNDEDQKKFLGGKRFDQNQILGLAGRAQGASGLGKAEFLKGVQDYIAKSSDWKAVATEEGQGTLVDLAKLAKSSGSDFGEVMNAAGSMRVQNPNLDPAKMMQMMYGVIGQGKMGAVEMKDLASHASIITSGAGSFKLGEGGYKDQAAAQTALLGMSQIAVRASGSSADAATAVSRFTSELGAKGTKAEMMFQGQNLKLKDKDGKLLKASDLMENIFQATGGRVDLMGQGKGHIGLGLESIKLMRGAESTFSAAKMEALAEMERDPVQKKLSAEEKNKLAIKAGSKAVGDEARRFENATYSKSDSDKDLSEVLNTKSERFNKSMTLIMEVAERRVTPFVEKLAGALERNEPGIEKVLNMFADLATKVADNPLAGLGAMLGLAITTEMAKAQVGKLMTEGLNKSLAGTLGAGLSIAAAAFAIEQVGEVVINNLMKDKAKSESDLALSGMSNEEKRIALLNKMNSGQMTAADVQAAQAELTNSRAAYVQNQSKSGDGMQFFHSSQARLFWAWSVKTPNTRWTMRPNQIKSHRSEQRKA